MIRGDQVVVDRLGNPDHPQCVILLLSKLRNLVSGILRIIPAGIKEIADVVSFENFDDTLVVLFSLELETAGP